MWQMSLEALSSVEKTFYVSDPRDWIARQKQAAHAFDADDFFRHGFDGSGGDNYFDAGSCIDGRLTSAWNCKFKPLRGNASVLSFVLNFKGAPILRRKSSFQSF